MSCYQLPVALHENRLSGCRTPALQLDVRDEHAFQASPLADARHQLLTLDAEHLQVCVPNLGAPGVVDAEARGQFALDQPTDLAVTWKQVLQWRGQVASVGL